MLELDELLGEEIYDYAKKYERFPVLMSLRYEDTGNATKNHPLMSCLSILMNPMNSLDVRITPMTSTIKLNSKITELSLTKKQMSERIHEIFETEQGLPKVIKEFYLTI